MSKGQNLLRDLIYLFRPWQWTKNLFVFAPSFFAGKIFDFVDEATIIFLCFCLSASGIYAINDVIDFEKDRSDPSRMHRPVASGRISRKTALLFGLFLSALSLVVSATVQHLTAFVALYIVLNIMYSLWLKADVILGTISVALGFVIRVLAGGYPLGITPTSWILICTFFLATFISSLKKTKDTEHFSLFSASLTVISYSLYVVEIGNIYLLLTVPPVVYGIFRYWTVAHLDVRRDPSIAIFDPKIVASVLVWLFVWFFHLGYFNRFFG